MAYITYSNFRKIIDSSDKETVTSDKKLYYKTISIFNKFERNYLLSAQELLEDFENYFLNHYKRYESEDTLTYVVEGQKPAYHKYDSCPNISSDFKNYVIPNFIKEQGKEKVTEFRDWFKSVQHLVEDKPSAFEARFHAKWGRVYQISGIYHEHTRSIDFANFTISDLKNIIDKLLVNEGTHYYSSVKRRIILDRFSKSTFLANSTEKIINNDTGFSDDTVKEELRTYEKEIKQPIKERLIQYYVLLLNSELDLDSNILDQLGFKQCSKCHNPSFQAEISKTLTLSDNQFTV